MDSGTLMYKLYFLMSQKNITYLEIEEIENILDNNINTFSEEEIENILELMIDNTEDNIKLLILSRMDKIIKKFPWSLQILIFMISEPNEKIFQKTIDLLKMVNFDEIKEEITLELTKQLQGRKFINIDLLSSEREILAYDLLISIQGSSLAFDSNLQKRESVDLDNMIFIQEGNLDSFKSTNLKLELSFSKSRENPKSFYIDKYPVTNLEYDDFCKEIEEYGHIWCHSDENCNKNHSRSTLHDENLTPETPVTGIDWYDAYAYANWKGKKLPNEIQWSKAAKFENIVDMVTTQKWEWTRTRYLDFSEQNPYFRGMNTSFVWNDWTAWTIVKGKSQDRLNDIENIEYLDKKLLLEKNPDIGFRCIYEL